MKPTLCYAAFAAALVVHAHPGGGIVALSENSALTGDAINNGLWRFEKGKKPKKLLEKFHCHWVTRGLDGNLYAENLGEMGGSVHRLLHEGSQTNPLMTEVEGYLSVFAVGRSGELIYQKNGAIVVAGGGQGKFAVPTLGRGEPALGEVGSFVWGSNDTLYLADVNRIRRVEKGVIRTIAKIPGPVTDKLYAGRNGEVRVWGMTVDSAGNIFAAVPSNEAVVRVDVHGKQKVISKTTEGWAPVGVAVHEGTVILLESKTYGNQNDGPRVRTIRPGGKIESWGQSTY